MKINIFNFFIAFFISLLLSYFLFNIKDDEQKILLSVGGFILFISTLSVTICIAFEDRRKSINLKIFGGLFFSIFLFDNIFFATIHFKNSTYITFNGILMMFFLLLTYNLNKTKLS